jgi:hypothetical protein
VVACTIGGRRHRGVVVAVGNRFVVLSTGSRRPVLMTFDGLAWVRAAPGEGVPPAGDRTPVLGRSVAEAIEELAGDSRRLQLVPGDPGLAVTGEIVAVGRDVVTVRVDGEPGGLVYVRLDALTEVQAPDS